MKTTSEKPERSQRDQRVGVVVSDKGDKTIRVRYDYLVKHAKYGKLFRRSTTLGTHDERNEAKKGDIVEVVACRRLSKTKCWRLSRIVKPGEVIDVAAEVVGAPTA